MRIELDDAIGYRYIIDSADPELIGKWFSEKAAVLMSADTRYNHPISLDIWPSTEHERLTIGQHSMRPVTSEKMLELARHFTEVSAKLHDLERAEWDAAHPPMGQLARLTYAIARVISRRSPQMDDEELLPLALDLLIYLARDIACPCPVCAIMRAADEIAGKL